MAKFAEDSGLTGQIDQSGYDKAGAKRAPSSLYSAIRIDGGQAIVKEFHRNSRHPASLTVASGMFRPDCQVGEAGDRALGSRWPAVESSDSRVFVRAIPDRAVTSLSDCFFDHRFTRINTDVSPGNPCLSVAIRGSKSAHRVLNVVRAFSELVFLQARRASE